MGDAALEETDQVDAEIRALMARKSVLGRQKKIKGQRRQRLQEKLRGYNPVEVLQMLGIGVKAKKKQATKATAVPKSGGTPPRTRR